MPKKIFRYIGLGLAAAVLGTVAWDVATYDAEAWGADYARLKHDMAQGYANLDWIAEKRGLDLAKLDTETAAAIGSAHSRVRAYLALQRFVEAFGDPHFQIEYGSRDAAPASEPASDTPGAAPADPPAGADCAAAGYGEDDHGFAAPFAEVAGWKPVGGGNFPTGMIGDTGVLRIAQFGEDRYLTACTKAFRPGLTQRELQLATRAVLQDELRTAIGALKRRGATRLLVDVSGNGGGTEWVSEVIALMTSRVLTRREPRIVEPACDRAIVWRGVKPCPVFSGEGAPASIEGEGAWTGPLLVLVDGGTASASEDFAVWLKENGVAKLIGERTFGAGCGYMDGGTVTNFTAAPVVVKMPNCARFMADGTNEIEGIAPDVPLPMGDDDRAHWPVALTRVLAAS